MQRKHLIPLFFCLLSVTVVSAVVRYHLDVPSHIKIVPVNDLKVTWVENGTEVTFIEWGTMLNYDSKTLPLINVTSTTDTPIWLSVFCELNTMAGYNFSAFCIEKGVDIATRGYDTPTIMLAPYESVTLQLTLTTNGIIEERNFYITFNALDAPPQ